MIKYFVEKAVRDGVNEALSPDNLKIIVEENLAKQLPSMIREMLEENKSGELSKIGFMWAGAIGIVLQWPSVKFSEAAKMFGDYLFMADIEYGDTDYDWSYAGAKEIVTELIHDIGETP